MPGNLEYLIEQGMNLKIEVAATILKMFGGNR